MDVLCPRERVDVASELALAVPEAAGAAGDGDRGGAPERARVDSAAELVASGAAARGADGDDLGARSG